MLLKLKPLVVPLLLWLLDDASFRFNVDCGTSVDFKIGDNDSTTSLETPLKEGLEFIIAFRRRVEDDGGVRKSSLDMEEDREDWRALRCCDGKGEDMGDEKDGSIVEDKHHDGAVLLVVLLLEDIPRMAFGVLIVFGGATTSVVIVIVLVVVVVVWSNLLL